MPEFPGTTTREERLELAEMLRRRGLVDADYWNHGDGRLLSTWGVTLTEAGEQSLEAAYASELLDTEEQAPQSKGQVPWEVVGVALTVLAMLLAVVFWRFPWPDAHPVESDPFHGLAVFDGPDASWVVIETMEDALRQVFGEQETLSFEADDNATRLVAYRRADGFVISATDVETLTAGIDSWHVLGQHSPPYYVRSVVRQVAGPERTRACGIRFGLSPSNPEDGWLMVKVAGDEATVSEGASRLSPDEVNHPQLTEPVSPIDPSAEYLIEVLVEDGNWTVAINGLVLDQRESWPIGVGFVHPAVQLRLSDQRANAECEFSSWEIRAPE